MAQILLLDDEGELREEVAYALRAAKHEVVEVATCQQFLKFFAQRSYDVVIVDRMLPDGDGLDLVNDLRSKGSRCGVVVFTAKVEKKDRLDGFQRGVDHYLAKPLSLDELRAVVDALAWRVKPQTVWQLDAITWILKSPESIDIRLTAQEFNFLSALNKVAPKVLSRLQLLEFMGKDFASYDLRNLDALVLRLRKKVMEQTLEVMPLKTVHGKGYALTECFGNQ